LLIKAIKYIGKNYKINCASLASHDKLISPEVMPLYKYWYYKTLDLQQIPFPDTGSEK
jgi:hypothetical protein